MFVSHLYVFFGEMFVQFFGPFFDWVVYEKVTFKPKSSEINATTDLIAQKGKVSIFKILKPKFKGKY